MSDIIDKGRPIVRKRHARPELSRPFAAPRTEEERIVAQLWQEVLAVEAVGIDDDFIDLGGNSLAATRLLGRLRERFASAISVKDIFAVPTVAGMAAMLCDEIIDLESCGRAAR